MSDATKGKAPAEKGAGDKTPNNDKKPEKEDRSLQEQKEHWRDKAKSFENERDALIAKNKADDEAKLIEGEKWKELSEKRDEEIQLMRKQTKQAQMRSAFVAKITAHNPVDIDGAMKLADLSSVDITDTGEVVGMDAAIEKLVADKPYLFEAGGKKSVNNNNAPSPSNTQNDGKQRQWHASEVRELIASGDTDAIREAMPKIKAAKARGNYIDD